MPRKVNPKTTIRRLLDEGAIYIEPQHREVEIQAILTFDEVRVLVELIDRNDH